MWQREGRGHEGWRVFPNGGFDLGAVILHPGGGRSEGEGFSGQPALVPKTQASEWFAKSGERCSWASIPARLPKTERRSALSRLLPSTMAIAGPESDPDDVYWDDQFWVPGTNGVVRAVVADGEGNVYIGGHFSAVADIFALSVAKWDGSEWHPLGSGIDAVIHALALKGDELYAGGHFWEDGYPASDHIAKWNGTSWSSLGSGINWPVSTIAVMGNDVYAGGYFHEAGGKDIEHLARWDGSEWWPVSREVPDGLGGVEDLAVQGTDLYVGGTFKKIGAMTVNNIARWDGSSWHALGSGLADDINDQVWAVSACSNHVYAGGRFVTSGEVTCNNIAVWDGALW